MKHWQPTRDSHLLRYFARDGYEFRISKKETLKMGVALEEEYEEEGGESLCLEVRG